MRSVRYPTIFNPPTNYTTTQVATCSGANYTTYSVPEDGWYQVDIRAGGGAAAYNNKRGGISGGKVTLVYLYQGMTCLLWSGTQGSYSDPGGVCGFPGTKDNTFGGQGATRYYSESGGGGGGAADYKVDMIDKLDVDYVVTICPFCEFNISDSLEKKKSKTSVINIMELLNKAYE